MQFLLTFDLNVITLKFVTFRMDMKFLQKGFVFLEGNISNVLLDYEEDENIIVTEQKYIPTMFLGIKKLSV